MPEIKSLVPPGKKDAVRRSVATNGKSGRVFKKRMTLGDVPLTKDEKEQLWIAIMAGRLAPKQTGPVETTTLADSPDMDSEPETELDPLLKEISKPDTILTREDVEIFERDGVDGLLAHLKAKKD